MPEAIHADPLVSTSWLAERLEDPNVRVIDASWYLPSEGRDGRKEYETSHIPGAAFFDIDAVSDTSTDLPHMLPNPYKFADAAGDLNLRDDTTTVIYDGWGVRSATRAWWTFRVMGLEQVYVLDGGLPKWIAEGRPLTDQVPERCEGGLTLRPDLSLVFRGPDVVEALKSEQVQIVDARPAARFRGDAPEPREGLRSGHMPGAFNVPMSNLLDASGTMKSEAQLAEEFAKAGVDIDRPIATSCGSGITACVLALGLARLGHWKTPVYDGSWAEWGRIDDCPVVTG